jgi:hypothetical protein
MRIQCNRVPELSVNKLQLSITRLRDECPPEVSGLACTSAMGPAKRKIMTAGTVSACEIEWGDPFSRW